MHLKALTLRGFKSFASATTLRLEPGVTCVVGPNGSGKSNVVDAIAWVLGEQGAKALRGGKMEDVIFAGTSGAGGRSGRAPLGRAEVTLTIDNSDNALPIDYAEVTITRRMFRSGESDYEINGDSCRLLDIQELLSDSGIGREMHVIVGQGQLDAVLQARPEDRRGFIEEAAGVRKHRKRKEKALRKLDAMQANLTRITDLTAELRRQLKPLGKQAEIARRAATIQAELRDSRLRLLAEDLVILRAEQAKDVADESALLARRAGIETSLAAAQESERELESSLAADVPLLEQTQETWHRLSQLGERLRGTARLAADRARHLGTREEPPPPGRDPELLEAEADEIAERESVVGRELAATQETLSGVVRRRAEGETALADAERALLAAARAFADRRESLATLAGSVDALRSRTTAAGEEIERLAAATADARDRATSAQREFEGLQGEIGVLDEGELGLDERHESAVAAHERIETELAAARDAERDAERERTSWQARAEALALGLNRKDGAGALLAAADRLPGVLGALARLLSVEPGYETAVAAALGGLADAVAVADASAALASLRLLKSEESGRASLVIAGKGVASAPSIGPPGELPRGARWLTDLVQAPPEVRPAVRAALHSVAVVADLETAAGLAERFAGVRAVTQDGDILAADHATGGSANAPSMLEIQAAVDEASHRRDEAHARVARLTARIDDLMKRASTARTEVGARLSDLHESDARMSAVAERLGDLGAAARSAGAEAERLERARQDAETARERDAGELSAAEERLTLARAAPLDENPSTAARDQAAELLGAIRQAEVEARLAVRTAEERARALVGRAESLRRAGASERAARARAEAARTARARGAAIATVVAGAAERVIERLDASVAAADTERVAALAQRQHREGELVAVRARGRELSAELEQLVDVVHRDEVARAEQRMRIDALAAKALQEYGIDAEALGADYGPDASMPPSAAELAEHELARERGEHVTAPVPGAYDRRTCERRAQKADRELRQLGKVNPLALEEFAALEERHAFLSEQLEDLKSTRRDLMTVVREVDERIHDVFASAFADTAREFEVVFATLFPGGEGRLVLTEPDDLLASGVEVEARPPGKRVKRLSLLSGGERSLVAVALLVAIFRARPSPFYVLDEIEAALDDTNLGRLIGLLEELRRSSQLIVITHQKRTMEIADALYGVSMRDDGITTVISQRLRELVSA